MIEQIWNSILEFTSKLVIPDWPSVIAMLPVVLTVIVVAFVVRIMLAWATAGPKRIRPARVTPVAPPGVHMPGPSLAPVLGAIGTFLLFVGLVFGGPTILLGLIALVLTLLYWGREALMEYDHMAGSRGQLPVVVHPGPPPGVHIPGPSFRPILASLAVAVLFAGLVFGGWLLGVGVIFTIVTLLGWLSDARREYIHVEAADITGHIATDPPPGWPKTLVSIMAGFVVVAVVLNLGWFPPRSAVGADGGPAPSGSPAASANPGEIVLVAKDIKFDKTTVSAPADKPFKISFDNQDVGTPHDVDILDAGGSKIFDGKDFPGPEVRVYDVPPIPAGTYRFDCSIHPALMSGELTAGG